MVVKKDEIRIGMVGYQFMGKMHSHAYRDVPFYFDTDAVPVLQAIAGRQEGAVKEAADRMGWVSYETDWRNLIERDDIDVIDIVTPNHTHADIAIAAAEAGKHIISEKPLALTLEDAKAMHQAVEKNNVVHMICHNYRFAPAVQYAKQLIEENALGRIYHIRANYLQDFIMDPSFPLIWRLKKEVSGTGALGDIGAHSIDLARFLVGEMTEVCGMMETFIDERPLGEMSGGLKASSDSQEYGEVTVDDATAFLARFENGAMGTFEATRFANGNRNKNKFEINGEKGSVRWDMENMNNLDVYFSDAPLGLQGFKTINCTEEAHPYAGAYWPPGHIIGYEHTFINLMYEFVKGISSNRAPEPHFGDGVKNQAVMEAVERSAATKRFEDVHVSFGGS
ncbi:Gfo/Idh/MocA family protein [Thalassobacillus sp. CUG 92003]|uniref:Gfo/Idh/MocA family protein n=1 Tax=Thalassobacillus sp. CUG 92003 TaxID=2736641 RepID=UPI001C627B84|nr:Gfo/Idh/MocA family oxidoreductase [Thalassobacillus sp. CUG 92003]